MNAKKLIASLPLIALILAAVAYHIAHPGILTSGLENPPFIILILQ